MPTRRSSSARFLCLQAAVCALASTIVPPISAAQAPASSARPAPPAQTTPGHASVPAGAEPPPSRESGALIRPAVSARVAREADDAYLAGAKEVAHDHLAIAEKDFGRAVQLNPGNQDYILALTVTREQRVTELVEQAAQAHATGHRAQATALLDQAHALDPDNRVVSQHFHNGLEALPSTVDPTQFAAADIASTLSGAIELAPTPGTHSFHLHGVAQYILRSVYSDFGIRVSFDPSVTPTGPTMRLDLDDVDFTSASRVLEQLTHVFAVPVQPKLALLATDTPENRERLEPLLEETIYLPGIPNEEMTELANLARNVFGIRQVTANSTGGNMLLRGDEATLRLVNATFADMLDGGSDVMLDVKFYELDTSLTRDIGAVLPSSAGVFSITAEAQQLVSANQSIIDQAIAAGLIKVTGNSLTDLITEVGFLIASGTVNASQYANLLGIFGNGLSLAGVYLGSNASFNLLLNSSETRLLDSMEVRAGNRQLTDFRAGERYPIVTGTYSSGIGSSLSSALAGLNINGTSVSSLLSQYLGTTSATVPEFQFEDLGLTLNTTPQVLRSGDVYLKLDLKLEALAGGTIDNIPILSNRRLTSNITVPPGQTALLASAISSQEQHAIQGLPGLSELPGFQGTDKDLVKSKAELLITITPHIVRSQSMHVASRRLSFPVVHAAAGDF